MMRLEEMLDFMNRPAMNSQSDLDLLIQHLVQIRGHGALEDDFSIVRFTF